MFIFQDNNFFLTQINRYAIACLNLPLNRWVGEPKPTTVLHKCLTRKGQMLASAGTHPFNHEEPRSPKEPSSPMSVLSRQRRSRKTNALVQGHTAKYQQPLTSPLSSVLALPLSSNFRFWISHLLALDLFPACKWRQLDQTSAGRHRGLRAATLESDRAFTSWLCSPGDPERFIYTHYA